MRGPFGILLVGGAIILMAGLFTGKITFPGASVGSAPSITSILGGATPAGNTPAMGNPTQPNGAACPSGQVYSPYFKKCIAQPIIGGH